MALKFPPQFFFLKSYLKQLSWMVPVGLVMDVIVLEVLALRTLRGPLACQETNRAKNGLERNLQP